MAIHRFVLGNVPAHWNRETVDCEHLAFRNSFPVVSGERAAMALQGVRLRDFLRQQWMALLPLRRNRRSNRTWTDYEGKIEYRTQ